MQPKIDQDIGHVSVDQYVNQVSGDISVAMLSEGCTIICKIQIFRVVSSIHLTGWPTDKLTNWLTVWLFSD